MKYIKTFELMDFELMKKNAIKRLKNPTQKDLIWFNKNVELYKDDIKDVIDVDDIDNNDGIDNTNELDDVLKLKRKMKSSDIKTNLDDIRKKAKKLSKVHYKSVKSGDVGHDEVIPLSKSSEEWIEKNMRYQ